MDLAPVAPEDMGCVLMAIRLTDALKLMADECRLYSVPLPVISLPSQALRILRRAIEDDLGCGPLGLGLPLGDFQYDGISFVRQKRRVRVKAGRRLISDDEHFRLGSQWTAREIALMPLLHKAVLKGQQI